MLRRLPSAAILLAALVVLPSPARPADAPAISAKGWAIADGTGKLLWGSHEADARPIASTTKIMTAWIVLRLADENPKVLDEIVTYSERAAKTRGSSAKLHAGERLSVRELLYGLLLPSGNDAAVALAEHFGPRFRTNGQADDDAVGLFVAEMNQRAKALQLNETTYVDPNGLGKNQSSPRDLAVLTAQALRNERFRDYVRTRRHQCEVVGPDGEKRTVNWSNTNKLLGTEGYDGVKTGTTTPAGPCLVASGRRGTDRLIVVVLGAGSSDGRYEDARALFDWAWQRRGHPSKADLEAFRSRLLAATVKHLDLLLDPTGKVVALKGKSGDGLTAFAFYVAYEMTGNQKYRRAALELAERTLKAMRATKFGVLYIKDKDKGGGATIQGGGPPPLGWYTSAVAYICHKEGGREADLRYIASVLDNYAWNEAGWWSSDIDIQTGQSKVPLTKPSIINKNATMAMAAGMVSQYVRTIDPALSARLKDKVDKCVYKQIIPAQEADGFWHYSLSGNDPKNKDVLGYFMLTTGALIQLQQCTDSYCEPVFQKALDRACAFAATRIAPMTDPNHGPPCPADRRTPSTPSHFTLGDDPKRGFALATNLFGGKSYSEGVKIMDHALKFYPYGNAGQEGGHAAHPSAVVLLLLQRELGTPAGK